MNGQRDEKGGQDVWGRTRRRHPGTQTVCVTGGCGGCSGMGLWLISPGGLFHP